MQMMQGRTLRQIDGDSPAEDDRADIAGATNCSLPGLQYGQGRSPASAAADDRINGS